jgi:nucleoside-diphosphate-sugar epimerase
MKAALLKILILGGTNFLGPHLVEEIKTRGHEVTIFHRGTHPSPFPEIETLHGDRDGDLRALVGRRWDAIIDTSGHLPRVVEASSKLLKGKTDHYTFISTVGVYANFDHSGIDETEPVAKLEKTTEEITEKTYGALKADCEQIVQSYFLSKTLIVRPGLIVGPNDPTDRFTYWPVRIQQGGTVLVPGSPSRSVQVIDVRDLAAWIVEKVEKRLTGVYNATGQPIAFEKFLSECQKVCKSDVKFEWVSEEFLTTKQVKDWVELPLILFNERNMPGFLSVKIEKALKSGLKLRPLSETIAATLRWNAGRTGHMMQAGLDPAKEKELLDLWDRHQ